MKTRFFGLQFCCRRYESNFNYIDVVGAEGTKFGKITQNNGHYIAQGHSRSPISVPVEIPYASE